MPPFGDQSHRGSMVVYKLLRNLSKQELHAHINGSISEATMKKLVALKRKRCPEWGSDGNWEVSMQKGTQRTMEEVFQMFGLIHQLSDSEEAAYMITKDVIEEFADDNVRYLELRTTPRTVAETGMTKESYIKAVLKAIKEQNQNSNLDIVVKLLLAIDRRTTVEDAFNTVKLAEKIQQEESDNIIVGIDISGDPNKGDARTFIPVLKEARVKGFKLAIHLSEVRNQNEETAELLALPPDRIGHGTFLHPGAGGSQDLVDQVEKYKIPIELCLTSNIKTATVSKADDHHFAYWYTKKHLCTLGTDDKGVFCTSLSEEYQLAAQTFNLHPEQLWDISYASIGFSFCDDSTKERLRSKWKAAKSHLFQNLSD